MSDEDRLGLVGLNMTNFFKRELFMYALGDIKFKKPISLKKVAYTMGFILIWTLPIFFIFGLILNPFYVLLMIVPPIAAGHYATKPVFGGKTLIPFTKSIIKYHLSEPKAWLDLKNSNYFGTQVFFIENEIWISRRRELRLLASMKEQSKRKKK